MDRGDCRPVGITRRTGSAGRHWVGTVTGRAAGRGFTLLELLLALALTGLVLFTISMAVDMNMRAFHKRRSAIEQSQLARTLLRMIADDIRGAVANYEQDLSGVEKLLGEAAAGAVGGIPDGMELEGESGAIEDDLLTDDQLNTVDLASGATVPSKPGIYGNQFELQIDVSRLPRIEEYQQLLAVDPAEAMVDVPSDVKTVTYYVQSAGMAAADQGGDAVPDLGVQSEPTGLVRRAMDRSVTRWALENGLAAAQQMGDVIAPEVAALELSYFDGYEWRLEWDSELEGTLPVAIQIVLVMRPPEDPASAADPSLLDESSLRYYRSVVHVPTGRPVEETLEEDADLTSETDAKSSEGGGP